MGEFLDKVKARYDAPEAIAHRVALYLSTPDRRAVVIEASDDLHFYCSLVRRLGSKRPVEFYPGHGRSKVFKTLDVLTALGKFDRTYAIVDRDLNIDDPPLLYSGHCLVLDVYSYENYFANQSILVDIAKTSFGLEFGAAPILSWHLIAKNFMITLPESLRIEHAMAYGCRLTKSNCNLSNFRVTLHLDIDEAGHVKRTPDTTAQFIRETSLDESSISPEVIAHPCRSGITPIA